MSVLLQGETKMPGRRSAGPTARVILVPGMFRSGSTWCFNVVRELLLLAHTRDRILTVAREDIANVMEEAAANDSWDVIIIKGHLLDDTGRELVHQGSAAIIHSYRDPIDAIRSGMRAFGLPFEVCLRLVSGALETSRLIDRERQGCVIFYDDIEAMPNRLVASIAAQLRLSVSSAEIASIARKLALHKVREFTEELATAPDKFAAEGRIIDIGFSYYDAETFFHRRHVSHTDHYHSEYHISDAELLEIRKCFAGYVDERGRFLIRTSRNSQKPLSETKSSAGYRKGTE